MLEHTHTMKPDKDLFGFGIAQSVRSRAIFKVDAAGFEPLFLRVGQISFVKTHAQVSVRSYVSMFKPLGAIRGFSY